VCSKSILAFPTCPLCQTHITPLTLTLHSFDCCVERNRTLKEHRKFLSPLSLSPPLNPGRVSRGVFTGSDSLPSHWPNRRPSRSSLHLKSHLQKTAAVYAPVRPQIPTSPHLPPPDITSIYSSYLSPFVGETTYLEPPCIAIGCHFQPQTTVQLKGLVQDEERSPKSIPARAGIVARIAIERERDRFVLSASGTSIVLGTV
jgi:hypothetical protein